MTDKMWAAAFRLAIAFARAWARKQDHLAAMSDLLAAADRAEEAVNERARIS